MAAGNGSGGLVSGTTWPMTDPGHTETGAAPSAAGLTRTGGGQAGSPRRDSPAEKPSLEPRAWMWEALPEGSPRGASVSRHKRAKIYNQTPFSVG